MEGIVPFEISKKLQEKGFKEKCFAYYDVDENSEYCIDAPTISQVLKWLREKKEIMVFPVYSTNTSKWYCSIVNADSLDTYKLSLSDSYEQAALAGIEYVIDNIL